MNYCGTPVEVAKEWNFKRGYDVTLSSLTGFYKIIGIGFEILLTSLIHGIRYLRWNFPIQEIIIKKVISVYDF